MAIRNLMQDYMLEDGGMSLDDLLMQIQQLQPVYQEPVYQAPEPVQQVADAPVEQMVAPQTLLQTTELTQKTEETKSTKPSDSVIESLTQQILGQGTSENWQGGVDAKTAAKDMAKIMSGIGITDIRQFGKIPDLVTAEVQYGVNGQVARQDEDGNYYIMAQGGTDSEGNQINYRQSVSEADLSPIYGYNKTIDGDGSTTFEAVDPSKVIVKDGVPRVQVGETYGNKETGQVVPNTYSERQTGNAFGGTFEGSGNTGYRVDFAPDGTPVFYTTKSSSNDLLNIMASNPVVNAVATYFAYQAGGPAGVAALNAAQGKDIKDVAKATLLTYLGNEVIAPYISKALPTPDVPIDFVEGTTEQINDALRENFVNDLKKAGVTNPSEFLNEIGLNATKFASQVTEPVAAPVVEPTVAPIENVQVSAPVAPTPTINEVINAIVAQQPAVEVTAPRVEAPKVEAPKTVEQVIAAIIPELVMTSQAPKEPEQPIPTIVAPPIQETIPQITTIAERPSTITNETEPAPTIVAPPITETVPPKSYTTKEIIDMIRLGLLSASVLNATTQETGPTGFPIVPVPAEWQSPTYAKNLPTTAPTQLPPIDFGNRNLLIGTQWEKFLDPNYGKVPAPVQFNQPSDMSYDRLMSILGTSRDVLPSQALSINDVISGIQNQYGQTPTGSMG